jgi:hypothetical protein
MAFEHASELTKKFLKKKCTCGHELGDHAHPGTTCLKCSCQKFIMDHSKDKKKVNTVADNDNPPCKCGHPESHHLSPGGREPTMCMEKECGCAEFRKKEQKQPTPDPLVTDIQRYEAEITRLKNELATHFAKIEEQQAYIEKLESVKVAYDDISTRHNEASEFAQKIRGRLGQNIWHIALDVAKQAMDPKMIRIQRGIIVIMRDGNIFNFPYGNDETYKAWCKTPESNNFLTMLGAREEFLEHELERAEADDIARHLVTDCEWVDGAIPDILWEHIREYCEHTDPRKYTKKMHEEMKNLQEPVKP